MENVIRKLFAFGEENNRSNAKGALSNCRSGKKAVAIQNADDIAKFVRSVLFGSLEDCCIAICLNANYRTIGYGVREAGAGKGCRGNRREVFRAALMFDAAALIMARYEPFDPFGNPAPSDADRAWTKAVRETGEAVGIKLVDSVTVTDGQFFSFDERGQL